METTTTRYRSTETRHGGAVGWFVGHFGGRNKHDARVDTHHEKASPWHQHAGSGRSIAAKKSMSASALEQSELWPARDNNAVAIAHAPEPVHQMPLPDTQHAVEPVSFSESAAKVQPVLARARALSRRIVVARNDNASQMKPGHLIARFMKVTGAIEGIRDHGDIRFDLPARSLSSTLRLWRGSNDSTHYTPVYF